MPSVLIIVCRVRTSSGMFLRRGQDKIIRDIEKRIADFTFIPVGMRCNSCVSCTILCWSMLPPSLPFLSILHDQELFLASIKAAFQRIATLLIGGIKL